MDDAQRLWRRGYRYALALCPDPHTAEDLLHDAWASSLRARGDAPAEYLFRAIRSRWIDGWRRTTRVQFEAMIEEPPAPGRSAERRVSDRQELAEALVLLRVEEREVLFLHAVEGYSASEIGQLVDRPKGTVLSLLHRARARVREQLRGPQEVTG